MPSATARGRPPCGCWRSSWEPRPFAGDSTLTCPATSTGNTRTEDLWSALEEASGQPVTSIMNTWVKQMGYPLLQVETRRSNGELQLDLSQRRFLYDALLGEGEEDQSLWQVPVGITRQGSPDQTSLLMSQRQATVSLSPSSATSAEGWVKVNAGQTGFYRVSYSPEEWARLQAAVEGMQLPATDRLGLQNDAYGPGPGGPSTSHYLPLLGGGL